MLYQSCSLHVSQRHKSCQKSLISGFVGINVFAHGWMDVGSNSLKWWINVISPPW